MKPLRSALILALVLVSLVGARPAAHATTAVADQGTIQSVTLYGTATVNPLGAATNGAPPNTPSTVTLREALNHLEVNRRLPRAPSAARSAALALPAPPSNGLATASGVFGFSGLTNRDQELAGTGQYTLSQGFLEPPDQGLCVGNGFVIEAVNVALRVSTTAGTPASGVTPLNQFFRLPPESSRTNPTVFGPFLSDPKCYYDVSTARWFLTVLQIGLDPATGAFTTTVPTHTLIAVSQSANPLATWNLYAFDTTDDGHNGTPHHAGCPCFGDQPLIGADANGFYISTNEYPVLGPGFNGAQVYALSKAALANGTATRLVHIDAGALPTPDVGNPAAIWYSLQPAESPAAQFESANGGTEYFLSSLDFNGTGDNRLAVWALVNTASLASSTPAVALRHVVIGSETYVGTALGGTAFLTATQKAGPTPLAAFLNFYLFTNNMLETLQANDDRMNQVVFADGKLWSGVNTAENGIGVSSNVGIAYFIVTPSSTVSALHATMTTQGYVALGRDNVLFPSIGVNASGQGVMSFSVSGPDLYPSAGYAPIDATTGAGTVHVAGLGTAPEDGFTGYDSPFCPITVCNNQVGARWGDYSAAVADESGAIWLGAEYIPNAPRVLLANWGTFISRVIP